VPHGGGVAWGRACADITRCRTCGRITIWISKKTETHAVENSNRDRIGHHVVGQVGARASTSTCEGKLRQPSGSQTLHLIGGSNAICWKADHRRIGRFCSSSKQQERFAITNLHTPPIHKDILIRLVVFHQERLQFAGLLFPQRG
jgi:hypothetical protein